MLACQGNSSAASCSISAVSALTLDSLPTVSQIKFAAFVGFHFADAMAHDAVGRVVAVDRVAGTVDASAVLQIENDRVAIATDAHFAAAVAAGVNFGAALAWRRRRLRCWRRR
jgi:hypothetical protein